MWASVSSFNTVLRSAASIREQDDFYFLFMFLDTHKHYASFLIKDLFLLVSLEQYNFNNCIISILKHNSVNKTCIQ